MEKQEGLKILTQNMNIHHFVAHSYFSRDDRIEGLINILPQFDVICLQEVFTFNLLGIGSDFRKRILDAWPSFSAISEPAPWLQQDTGLVILSRHKILGSKTIFYESRNPKEYFSKKGALIVSIDTGNYILNVVTTHLDAHQPDMRELQLTQLMNELKSSLDFTKDKIILLGDINIHAGEKGSAEEFKKLLQVVEPLQEVRKLGGIEYTPTYTDGFICLDHMFVANIECNFNTFQVHKEWKHNDVPISDHYGDSNFDWKQTLDFIITVGYILRRKRSWPRFVRHGQSLANVNVDLFTQMADCDIPLSSKGQQQSIECGLQLKKYFSEVYQSSERPKATNCRLWTSPYLRARETGTTIFKICNEACTEKAWINSRCESILLAEQQFGLFEGREWSTLEGMFPKEVQYYRKCSQQNNGGRFWLKMPLGESRFDVCVRISQLFDTIKTDYKVNGINDVIHIVVSHGVTIRAFILMWRHLNREWLETEQNPNNCSIRLLEGQDDLGYIWNPSTYEIPKIDRINTNE